MAIELEETAHGIDSKPTLHFFPSKLHSRIYSWALGVLKIKYSLCHTHPNRGAEVHKFILFFFLLVWFKSLIGPKSGMTLPTLVTSYIVLNLGPKLKGNDVEPPNPTQARNQIFLGVFSISY